MSWHGKLHIKEEKNKYKNMGTKPNPCSKTKNTTTKKKTKQNEN